MPDIKLKLDRKIMRVEGKDRVKFLHDLLTISVEADMPLRYGALLSPQGKVLSDVFVFSEKNALFLDLPVSAYDEVYAKFQLYKLRAEIEIFDDPRPVWQIEGKGDPRGQVGKRSYDEGEIWDEKYYQQARIDARVPEFGVDFESNEAYPREWRFDEMRGVDYQKGCFVGQEIVARMRHKSELLKSVVRVCFDAPLEFGTKIKAGEKEIGKLLSSNAKNGLAFLRLKGLDQDNLTADGTKLTLDER